MTLQTTLFALLLLIQLLLTGVRSAIWLPRLAPVVRYSAILVMTLLAGLSLWALLQPAGVWLSIPVLVAMGTIQSLDPSYATTEQRAPFPKNIWSLHNRIILAISPAALILTSIILAHSEARGVAQGVPLGVGGIAALGMMIGAYQAWSDFQKVYGLESDEWKILGFGVDEVQATRTLPDREIWTRVILVCSMIIILVLQVAALKSTWENQPIEWWSLVPATASLCLAGLAYNYPRSGRFFACAALTSSWVAVGLSSCRMLAFSDLSTAANAYRVVVGLAVGAMYAEDLLVSFRKLNGLSNRLSDWLFAAYWGIGFCAIFAHASSVSYYGGGEFRIAWILFNGLLLLSAFVSSVLSWRAIGRQAPAPLLLTLKQPEEIALADNAMFIALLGGSVAGASLLSNGEDPRASGALGGLVLAFIYFAVNNDRQHFRNENTRLLTDPQAKRISSDVRSASLRALRWHLRFQERLPTLVVVVSFWWAVLLDWL